MEVTPFTHLETLATLAEPEDLSRSGTPEPEGTPPAADSNNHRHTGGEEGGEPAATGNHLPKHASAAASPEEDEHLLFGWGGVMGGLYSICLAVISERFEGADQIAAKIRKAKTDPEPLPDTAEGLKDRPEARNLVNIYAALSGQSVDQVVAEYAGAQFGAFKPKLADLAVAKLSPITSEMNRLMKDPAEIDRILGKGADRAEAIARPIVDQVYDILGMVRSRR